jgi:hypothetical protein
VLSGLGELAGEQSASARWDVFLWLDLVILDIVNLFFAHFEQQQGKIQGGDPYLI